MYHSLRHHSLRHQVVECFRKLLLSAALIFITPGSATQGLFALIMAMGSQRLYVGCKQFPDPSDNRLGELAQWQLVFIFLAALMLQMNLSSNVTHYDEVIFDYTITTILFIGPAISFLEPLMPMICGKKAKLAEVNLGTIGMAPPAMPKELKAAMKVAKQVGKADSSANAAKAAETSAAVASSEAVEISDVEADVEAAAESTRGHAYDYTEKDPSPLMRRKLADQTSRGGSENTHSAGVGDGGMAV